MRPAAAAAAVLLAVAAQAAPVPPFQKGLKLKKDGKFAAAAEVFSDILAKKPKDADALEQLATLQGWLGKHDEALATWRKALALAPDNSDYRLGLARVLYWKQDFKGSLKELDAVLDAAPESVEALTLDGDVLLAAGRAPEARKAYLKAQALAPDDAELAKKLERAAAAKK